MKVFFLFFEREPLSRSKKGRWKELKQKKKKTFFRKSDLSPPQDVPAIGQTYLLFRGKLVRSSKDGASAGDDAAPLPDFAPGPESLEVAFFDLDEIPKLDLAFSAIATALRLFTEDVERHGHFHYHHGTILKHPGGAPNAGTLVDHFAMAIRN